MKRIFRIGLVVLFLGTLGSLAWAQAPTADILKNVAGKLVDSSGAEVTVDLAAPKYLLVYFSAHWCPPCRAFTPRLVEFYNKNKEDQNFELVFVSRDKDEQAMLEYMTETKMPWPAVKYDAINGTGIRTYAGPGIPDLVLLDQAGKVLSDSYNGQEYLGPDKVLEDLAAKLQAK